MTDQKSDLMDFCLSESLGQDQILKSPEVEYEIKSRLKTFPYDKAESVVWEDAKRRLMLEITLAAFNDLMRRNAPRLLAPYLLLLHL